MRHNRKSNLLLVDRSLNHALGLKYAIYAAFGTVGILRGVPTIGETGGSLVEALWTVSVVFICGMASVIAWNGQHETKEMYAGIAVISVLLCYVVAAYALAFQGVGSRDAFAVLTTALLIFPGWRTFFLFGKVRRGERLNDARE